MNADRAHPHLPPPPPPVQLQGFPTVAYRAGTTVFRSHQSSAGPWWYASAGDGRFDVAEPSGTCYVAEDSIITLLETWGGMRVVPSYLADTRSVSTLRLPADVVLADVTSNLAAAYGVTAEISTTPDYPLTQLWAAAFHAAGYAGLRYWARHDLAHEHACLALFGAAGARPAEERAAGPVSADPDLLQGLSTTTGLVVLPLPPRSH